MPEEMNLCLIMRGIPGSGKSSFAETLKTKTGCVIHSTDRYFIENGEYKFDPRKLGENHKKNLEAFRQSCENKERIVICDNTNVLMKHAKQYQDIAESNGYMVAFVTMPHPDPETAAERNTHGVPLHAIQRMIRTWDPL